MIIGFLGKGGSGKSTLATLMTRHLHAGGNTVLAVDADHNMDLSYNLGLPEDAAYIGSATGAVCAHVGLTEDEHYSKAFAKEHVQRFTLTPPCAFTTAYSTEVQDKLRIMAAGPQTDTVLHGAACSHSLATPLKVYLPLLALSEREYVVVDEKASVDAVTTGIPTGFDLAVVCAEPREHSIRVARQIGGALAWYGVPHCFVANKTKNESDVEMVAEGVGEPVLGSIGMSDNPLEDGNKELLDAIIARATSAPSERLERTKQKFAAGEAFVNSRAM